MYEDDANGGYVHAPSLAQAATAAVLRNAYLSHASPSAPTPFAVNLSSARMRAAMELIEGVRNGQPIAALLGYQLERGLHERHPGIELDTIIYVLRERFPLVSGLLTDAPPGTSVETIEARNVIHGLDLVETTASGAYPWSVAGLPAGGTSAALAVEAEIDRLRDGLDAVADLLLAESVHQAVQGNVARTKASLQALTDPEAPPGAGGAAHAAQRPSAGVPRHASRSIRPPSPVGPAARRAPTRIARSTTGLPATCRRRPRSDGRFATVPPRRRPSRSPTSACSRSISS